MTKTKNTIFVIPTTEESHTLITQFENKTKCEQLVRCFLTSTWQKTRI